MKKRLIKLLILSIFIFSGYINSSYAYDYNFDVSITVEPSEIILTIVDEKGQPVTRGAIFDHGKIINGEKITEEKIEGFEKEIIKKFKVESNLESSGYITMSLNSGIAKFSDSNLEAHYSFKADKMSDWSSNSSNNLPFDGAVGFPFSLRSVLKTKNNEEVNASAKEHISSDNITLNITLNKVE